ncbi:Hypothetical protein, putative [Bodo saltans]|uniref:Uncharacterized protein n=1 Tax=Bodo saltans TaxID=75058 RepID=A0A0S4IUD3_BODSA|nr:Hypothetical protein, putative [Bodo saltans]|eukprot:CUF88821.1 Hypothetical protein, putative [Bodo saltans]
MLCYFALMYFLHSSYLRDAYLLNVVAIPAQKVPKQCMGGRHHHKICFPPPPPLKNSLFFLPALNCPLPNCSLLHHHSHSIRLGVLSLHRRLSSADLLTFLCFFFPPLVSLVNEGGPRRKISL